MRKVYLLFITVLVLETATTSCDKKDESGTVKYEVLCNPTGFDVSYENTSGNNVKITDSTDIWSITFNGNQYDYVYLTAKAKNKNATIKVKITYQGKIVEQADSIGDFATATAAGFLGYVYPN